MPPVPVSGHDPTPGLPPVASPATLVRTVSSLSLGPRAAGRVAPIPAPAAAIQAAPLLTAAKAATLAIAPVNPGLDPGCHGGRSSSGHDRW